MSKTLTLNRPYKVMLVDLARPGMPCKLVTRPSGRDRGAYYPGLTRGDSLFAKGALRFFWWGVRRLGFGIHLPGRRRLWFPPRRRRRIASVEALPRRIINQGSLSANIVGVGYQIVAGTAAEALSDEVWMDLIALASKHALSAPGLGNLGRHEQVELTEEEVAGLYVALDRALFAGEPAEHIATEDDTLDRDTVRRVSHVLRQPERKMLRRTPSWR